MSDQPMDRIAEQNSERFRRYNVLAVLPTLDAAREAMNALQRAGIESGNTSLLGPSMEAAEHDLETNEKDRGVIGDVTKATTIGGVAGGAIGGVTGFLAGLAAFAIPGVGPAIGTGLWVSSIGGAVLGSGVGGMLGGVSKINAGDAWELTYELKNGRAIVGVHSDDERLVQRGAEILKDQSPVSMGFFDEDGRHTD